MITRAEYLAALRTIELYEKQQNDEDEDEPEPSRQWPCDACGYRDGHAYGCPDDDSPYALLVRQGYD